jgi:hypothetical protein
MATKPEKIEKRRTDLQHVFLIDWHDDGILREIAVVMEGPDGTIYGIEVDKLHPIDKARLKKFVTSMHADKYPLWELLSQGKLNNGTNALDFFHVNYMKVKRPRGAVIGGGLASVEIYGDLDKPIGVDFTNGDNGSVSSETPSALGRA